MERYIILLRRLQERDVANCTMLHFTFALYVIIYVLNLNAQSLHSLNLKLKLSSISRHG